MRKCLANPQPDLSNHLTTSNKFRNKSNPPHRKFHSCTTSSSTGVAPKTPFFRIPRN